MPFTTKPKTPNIKLQPILLVVILLITLGLLTYKYYEWKTVKDLQNLFSQTQFEEMTRNEDYHKQDKEISELIKSFGATQSATAKKPSEIIDQIISKADVHNGFIKTDIDLTKESQKKFISQSQNAKYIFRQRGQYLKDITFNLNLAYDKSLEISNDSYIQSNAFQNVFALWKDNATVTAFNLKIGKDFKDNVPKFVNELSSLSKYASSNYKLREEDQIKDNYPGLFEYISNYKKYLGSFYGIMNNYASGDLQSAAYKSAIYDQTSKKINQDIASLIDENKDKRVQRVQDFLKYQFKVVESIKQLNTDKLNRYPFTATLNKWNEDLALCHLYDSKIGLYKTLTKELPKSQNKEDLFKDLATITPKSDALDKQIDQSQTAYSTTEKEIILTCTDPIHKKEFIFETLKD